MSDIVERLLKDAESHYEVARSADMRPEDTLNWEHGQNCQEAADTITALRADIINYKIGNKDLQDHCTEITSLTAENERLKVEARISYAEGFHDGDENGSKIKREFVEKLESEIKKLRAAIECALRQLADGNRVLATGTLAAALSGDKQ